MPTLELEVHEPVRMAIRVAFQSMDVVDLGSEFRRRACVMKDGPGLLEEANQVGIADRFG